MGKTGANSQVKNGQLLSNYSAGGKFRPKQSFGRSLLSSYDVC